MKSKNIIIILCLFNGLISGVTAQDKQVTGIRFFEGTYAALLQEAQRQHKMIFIDVYTDWCGPCKQMDKQIFPLKTVGDKYNPLFLSYKLNAEKGEGIKLAQSFNVPAYPTFLYLNSSGYLIHKVVGEGPAEVFNSHADKAIELSSDKNQLGNLEDTFKSGNRDPAFLQRYISRKADLALDNNALLDEWLKAIPAGDLKKEETLLFIGRHIIGAHSSALVFLMDHYHELSEPSKAAIRQHLYEQLAENGIPAAIGEKRMPEVKQLLSYVDQLGTLSERPAQHVNRINLIYAGMVKDAGLLKKSGYTMVGNVMSIPADSLRTEDARRYQQIMAPFLKGEKDSTKEPGFEEAKPYIINIYTREIHAKLFAAASSFSSTLDTGDKKALEDALTWAIRAQQLIPTVKGTEELIARLKNSIAAAGK